LLICLNGLFSKIDHGFFFNYNYAFFIYNNHERLRIQIHTVPEDNFWRNFRRRLRKSY